MVANRVQKTQCARRSFGRAGRRSFLGGFVDVCGRAFSLDFSSRIPLPDVAAHGPAGWERDVARLRGDWERVGGSLSAAILREGAGHA